MPWPYDIEKWNLSDLGDGDLAHLTRADARNAKPNSVGLELRLDHDGAVTGARPELEADVNRVRDCGPRGGLDRVDPGLMPFGRAGPVATGCGKDDDREQYERVRFLETHVISLVV
jgi:hypothetical protein